MVDDSLEEAGGASDTTKAKRAPPTIELEANEVSGANKPPTEASAEPEAGSEQEPEAAAVETTSPPIAPAPAPARISPWVIAPFSGAVAAALVILVGWLLGWPAVQAPPPAPQVDAATVDDLGKRLAAPDGKLDKLAGSLAPAVLQKPIKDLR